MYNSALPDHENVPAQLAKLGSVVLGITYYVAVQLRQPVVLVRLWAVGDPAHGGVLLVPETTVDMEHSSPTGPRALGARRVATVQPILLVRVRSGLDQSQAGVGPDRDVGGSPGTRRDAGHVRDADASGDQYRLTPVLPAVEQRERSSGSGVRCRDRLEPQSRETQVCWALRGDGKSKPTTAFDSL